MSPLFDVGATLPHSCAQEVQKGTLGWRKLHDLYCSPNYWGDHTKRTKWAEYAARMGNRRCAYRVLVGKSERKGQLEDTGVAGRIIFK